METSNTPKQPQIEPELTPEEAKRLKLKEVRQRWNKNKKDKQDAIKAKNEELEEINTQVKDEVNQLKTGLSRVEHEAKEIIAQRIKEDIKAEYEQKLLDLRFELEQMKITKKKERTLKRVEIYGDPEAETETEPQTKTSHLKQYQAGSSQSYNFNTNPFNKLNHGRYY